jgi:hypothetical protein
MATGRTEWEGAPFRRCRLDLGRCSLQESFYGALYTQHRFNGFSVTLSLDSVWLRRRFFLSRMLSCDVLVTTSYDSVWSYVVAGGNSNEARGSPQGAVRLGFGWM